MEDDNFVRLERLRKQRDANLKDLVNEAIRRGLNDMDAPPKRREPYQTKVVNLGRLLHPDLKTALETIERNVNLQSALIDDILDLSRIIRGKINLTFRTVRMGAVVDAALAAVRPTADAKGVALGYEMAADFDEISGDADPCNRKLRRAWRPDQRGLHRLGQAEEDYGAVGAEAGG